MRCVIKARCTIGFQDLEQQKKNVKYLNIFMLIGYWNDTILELMG